MKILEGHFGGNYYDDKCQVVGCTEGDDSFGMSMPIQLANDEIKNIFICVVCHLKNVRVYSEDVSIALNEALKGKDE